LAAATIHTDAKELFLQIAEGDEAAFGVLFHQYGPQLHSYLTGLTRSESSAEELLQNTFIRIWLNRDKLPGIEHPKAWIYTVASNEAFNFLKHKAVEARALKSIGEKAAYDNQGDDVLYREMKQAIREAVQALPPRRRQIYLLSREQGMKQQQIADELGISLFTVKNTLAEALESIREFLTVRELLMLAVLFTLR
jgi:RNA polymerase sigma-70 factor (ECF subfamily)